MSQGLLTQRVAVKLLDPNRATELVAVAEFETESDLLARLAPCKNVINYVGTWSSTVQVTLGGMLMALSVRFHVLELADGSLEDLLPDRDLLSWTSKLDLLRDAVCGAHQMHLRRVLHRDLKCANALLVHMGGKGHIVKVADLGRSRSLSVAPRLLPDGYAPGRGDPSFAPPEYIWLLGQADPRSLVRADLYLLGSLFFELCTGQGLTAVAFPGEWVVAAGYTGPSRAAQYQDRLSGLRAGLELALGLFARQLPPVIRQPACAFVRQLCDPDPLSREFRFRAERRLPDVGLQWVIRRLDILRLTLLRDQGPVTAMSRPTR